MTKTIIKITLNWAGLQVSKPTPTVTHFLQQDHTYSKKATPPNSATLWTKHIQTTIVLNIVLEISVWGGGRARPHAGAQNEASV